MHAIGNKIFILQLLLVLSSTPSTVRYIEKNGLHADETLFRFSPIKFNQIGPSVSQTAVHSDRQAMEIWIFMTLTVARSVYYVPFINCYCRMMNTIYTKLNSFFQYQRDTCEILRWVIRENFRLYNRDFNKNWRGLLYFIKINVNSDYWCIN